MIGLWSVKQVFYRFSIGIFISVFVVVYLSEISTNKHSMNLYKQQKQLLNLFIDSQSLFLLYQLLTLDSFELTNKRERVLTFNHYLWNFSYEHPYQEKDQSEL